MINTKNAQITAAIILACSPVLLIWGFPLIAGKVAVSALYALTILFILRKWKV